MGKYANKAMEALATDLAAGLVRLRKGYVDNAEALLQILDTSTAYPYEFVVFRLTGFRGQRGGPPSESLPGSTLRRDLLALMLDICDSCDIRAGEYSEPAYSIEQVARKFRISTKTVQRWRRMGLPARRLVFADEKRRLAFLETSLQSFVAGRERLVRRSMRFSQLTPAERGDIIRRARRMARFTSCCLSDVSRRLARRTGRAVETIRYTIRNHDAQHPDQAVFPYLLSPLDDQEKTAIYNSFIRGTSVALLAQQFHRTRSSIYRIVNEMRARQLLQRPITYIYNPQFDLPGAEEAILDVSAPPAGDHAGADKGDGSGSASHVEAPNDLPAYLRALYDVPLLTPSEEFDLFRRYNYLKYCADKLRSRIDLNNVRTAALKHIEAFLVQANVLKNRIVSATLRLVVSIAKKHLGGPQTLFELISDGNVSLLRALEKFDYSRGNRFSTYASWAIMRNYARSVPKERYQLDRFATGNDEVLDIAAGLKVYDPNEVNLGELRESIDAVLARLTPMERMILTDHYGLADQGQAKTLEQLGQRLGVSKERVRQIEIQAMKKLRSILNPQEVDLAP